MLKRWLVFPLSSNVPGDSTLTVSHASQQTSDFLSLSLSLWLGSSSVLNKGLENSVSHKRTKAVTDRMELLREGGEQSDEETLSVCRN